MSQRTRFMALFTALALCCAQPAVAGWSNNPGINLPVAANGNNQENPFVVEDGAGGAFFVWNEAVTIRAQHFGPSGYREPGWPAAGIVIASLPNGRFLSGVAPDGFGGFLAVWEDYRNGPTDIYVQRVSGSGSAQWAANGLQVIGVGGSQHSARVCADGSGGAIVAWLDERDLGTSGLDVYAQRIHSTGYLMWPGGAVAVCSQPFAQDFAAIVADGSPGGSYVLWRDARSGPTNLGIYASRLDSDGNRRPGWGFGGNALCTAPDYKESPRLVSDGNLGVIAAWADYRSGISTDIFAVRFTSAGALAPGWAANGVNLTNDVYNQNAPAIAPDGAGGAIVAWADTRLPNFGIHAQRISASGAMAWTAGGVATTQTPINQSQPVIAADGVGGAIVGWIDSRTPSPPMLYAQKIASNGGIEPGWPADGVQVTNQWTQTPSVCTDASGGGIFSLQANVFPQAIVAQRVDRWGYLGVQPLITSVKDVPNDQGGQVKVSWNRSPLDAYPTFGITQYLVFRSVPPNLANARTARGAALALDAYSPPAGDQDAWRGRIFSTSVAAMTFYWEYVTTVTPFGFPGYSIVAASEGDSVGGSNPRTVFMIRAEDPVAGRFWHSDPDSGYSVDNVAPAAPAPFTGVYQAGATHLHWGQNAEPDLAGYRLHRGTNAGFVPDAGNLVAAQPDTGYADSGPAGGWYKLVAVDSHGNQSPAVLLAPTGTTDVSTSDGSRLLSLSRLFPNPAGSSTECRFTLPAAGHARIEVFDPSGRRVRQLVDAALPAGDHAASWNGRDDSGGRVSGGLYFVRLECAGERLTRRLVWLGE